MRRIECAILAVSLHLFDDSYQELDNVVLGAKLSCLLRCEDRLHSTKDAVNIDIAVSHYVPSGFFFLVQSFIVSLQPAEARRGRLAVFTGLFEPSRT